MNMDLSPTILVRYKSGSSTTGLRALLALSPFWALWAPWVAVWSFSSAMTDPTMMSIFILMLSLISLSVFTIFVCLQNKVKLDALGIRFPLRTLFEMKFRLFRSWSELQLITFVDSNLSEKFESQNPDRMLLQFADGAVLTLELKSFDRQDLQNLLLALQSYVPGLAIRPPLKELSLGMSAENTLEKAVSFTQIWEDDMNSRFGSTAYVPLESGEKLQDTRLEIAGQIAFGGLSAVYLAKNLKTAELCVVKEAVLPRNTASDAKQKAIELFQREAKLLMSLRHPRIASLLDNFVENSRHYLLLEYKDGKDLRRFVRERGAQSEAMVLRWTKEAAEILAYLHAQSPAIIHRDLTPDNIVLESDGRVSLIDFGAANEFLGNATGTLVGKQAYISPEQFRGKATPASDLYSLGATMFFLLTAEDPEALAQSYPGSIMPGLSQETNELVAKLTSMECDARFESAEKLADYCGDLLKKQRERVISLRGN